MNDESAKESDGDQEKKSVEKAETEAISVDKIPQPFREIFVALKQTAVRSTVHPLLEKFKDEHVHKALDHLSLVNERQHELAKIDRRNRLLYFSIGAAIFVFLAVFLLPKDKEIFSELLKTLITVAGGIGIGGGYVVLKLRKERKL